MPMMITPNATKYKKWNYNIHTHVIYYATVYATGFNIFMLYIFTDYFSSDEAISEVQYVCVYEYFL